MKYLMTYLFFGLFLIACTNDNSEATNTAADPDRKLLMVYQDSVVAIQNRRVEHSRAFINRITPEIRRLVQSEDPAAYDLDFESFEQEVILAKQEVEVSIQELNAVEEIIPRIGYQTNMLKLNAAMLDFIVAIEDWMKSYKADRSQDVETSFKPVLKVGEIVQAAQRNLKRCENELNEVIKRTTAD